VTPETNAVHDCHGCQYCFGLMLDDPGADAPPACERYPECDPPDETNTCRWPDCADVQNVL
jgi:hypothetical protein